MTPDGVRHDLCNTALRRRSLAAAAMRLLPISGSSWPPSALLERSPICTLPFRSALAAGRGTVLSRRADLVGYGSSPGCEISLVGMRHDLRIRADRRHQSYVEVPVERPPMAAADQPDPLASLYDHLASVGRR
jgi:hypothetical protein